MELYKFSELSEKAKQTAVSEFIHDAKCFGFFDGDVNREVVYEILSSPHETH